MEENIVITENAEAQEPVVEVQPETAEKTPVVEEQPVEERPVKKPQSREVNHQFKLMRQEKERLQRQVDEMNANNSRLLEALKGYGYSGTPEEVTAQIRAAQAGIPYEEYQRQQEQDKARYKEMMQNDPDYLAAQQKADFYEREVINRMMVDDLAAINKAFPEAKIKSLQELGDDYFNLIGAGVNPLTAYTAVKQAQEATKKPVPPVMGALNKTPAEKDFYTSEEVDELYKNHPELADDPKTAEIIRYSMTRW